MKIIIEGCDGVGKSTLAKILSKLFNAKLNHDSKPCDLLDYLNRLEGDNNEVFDRFMLGQFVYNTEEERKLSREELKSLLKYCNSRSDVLLVYVELEDKTLLERLKSRNLGEQEKDKEMMKRLKVSSYEMYISKVKANYEEVLRLGNFLRIDGGNINASIFNDDRSME